MKHEVFILGGRSEEQERMEEEWLGEMRRGEERGLRKRAIVTPHAQRERGKVIDRGVHISLTLANGCNPTSSFAQTFQHANDIHSRHYE